MGENINHQFIYKSAGIISYFIFSLLGLSILFNFSPRVLLFTNSIKDELKRNLFKDFHKMVYDNINKPLIKEIQFSLENEPCPEGLEVLKVEHQYYGTFSKFYGNASFCLKRYNNSEYAYEKLLQNAENECSEGKKRCGKLNGFLDLPLCINNNDNCPLNQFDITVGGGIQTSYPIPQNKSYLLPFYGENEALPPIINIEVINNEKLCLEKFHREQKSLTCELPDNNQCFIFVSFMDVKNPVLGEDLSLYAKNLLKWNIENYEDHDHYLCQDDLKFHILASGYFNFTHQNLQDFKQEFPIEDKYNNPLYLTSQAYKENINIDLLFRLMSCVLISFSICQFIFQILVCFNVEVIRKYYICFGNFLFICKLLSYFGMIIYHFLFYLKIKKVYITLIDEPLKILLKEYNSTRSNFIKNIIIFWVIGFIIICVDLIILTFTVKLQWGKNFIIKSSDKSSKSNEIRNELSDDENDVNQTSRNSIEINNMQRSNINIGQQSSFKPSDQEKIFTNQGNFMMKTEPEILDNNNKIMLSFVCKEAPAEIYELEAQKTEYFKDLIVKLKEKYNTLKEKKLKVFSYGSNIININQKLEDIGISENVKIVMISD
jgi:hypothetical protein